MPRIKTAEQNQGLLKMQDTEIQETTDEKSNDSKNINDTQIKFQILLHIMYKDISSTGVMFFLLNQRE